MNEQELRVDYRKRGYADGDIDVMLGLRADRFKEVESLPFGCIPDEGKPYPGEHACRLQSPDKFDKFARKNCFRRAANRCIDFIFGIKAGKSEVQAMRYKTSAGWTAADASAHCKVAKGTFEAAGE